MPTDPNPSLCKKHRQQVLARNERAEPFAVCGVTIEPGDNTSSFIGKHYLPLNSPLLIVQHSARTRDRHGRPHRAVDCRGYRSAINPTNGSVLVGTAAENKFCYDLGFPVFQGAKGRQFDPYAKASNVRTLLVLLEIDRERARAVERGNVATLPTLNHVVLPDYLLGFAEGRLPNWEPSGGFTELALRAKGLPVPSDLWRLGDDARKALLAPVAESELEELWGRAFVPPYHPPVYNENGALETAASGDEHNGTGMWLIDHKLCSKANHSLRNFEGVSKMLGRHVHNPVARIIPHTGSVELPNPAGEIAKALKVNLATVTDDAAIAQLQAEFRQRVGEAVSRRLPENAVAECLEHPDRILAVPQGSRPLKAAELPQDLLAKAMRMALDPRVAECVTDADLLTAARNPGERLYASGMAKVQLFRLAQANAPESFVFGPRDLGRPKVTMDLWSVQAWYYSKGARVEASVPTE